MKYDYNADESHILGQSILRTEKSNESGITLKSLIFTDFLKFISQRYELSSGTHIYHSNT